MTNPLELQENIDSTEEQTFLNENNSDSSNIDLPQDTLLALEELGTVLFSIHKRMVSEGFEIRDGCIHKISE